MKPTLKEEIQNFKRLVGEATDTSSSGAYEQPLGFNQSRPTTICPQSGQPIVGSEVAPQAPSIDVVDVTQAVIPMDEPTSYEGNMNATTQPGFDEMPFLSSHPSGWTYQGDEEELLQRHGLERPTAPDTDVDDEEEMSIAFDEMDDGTDVFQELKMMSETTNGLGW